jgi:hypothetical protein
MAKTTLDKFEQALRIFEAKIQRKNDMVQVTSLRTMLYSIMSFVSLNLKNTFDESQKLIGKKSFVDSQKKALNESFTEFKKFSTELKVTTNKEYKKEKYIKEVNKKLLENDISYLKLQLKHIGAGKKRKSKLDISNSNTLKLQITEKSKELRKINEEIKKDVKIHKATINSITIANAILNEISTFAKGESDVIKTLIVTSKVKKYAKVGVNATAIAASLALGSGLPLAIPEGINALIKRAGEFKKESGKEKLKSAGLLGLKAAGLLGGSAGLMMLSTSLSQKRNERMQKENNIKSEIYNFRKSLRHTASTSKKGVEGLSFAASEPNDEMRKLIKSLKRSGGLSSSFSAKTGGRFGVKGGQESGAGGLIDNLRVHKGETVTVTPAKDNTTQLLKLIADRLIPLKKLEHTAEEALEDSRDAVARGSLLSKPKNILSARSLFGGKGTIEEGTEGEAQPEKSGFLSNISSSIFSKLTGALSKNKFIKKIPGLSTVVKAVGREGSPVYITNWHEMRGGLNGGFPDLITSKGPKGPKGTSTIGKLLTKVSKAGGGLLSKGGGLLSSAAGGGLLSKGAGLLSKAGPLLGGLAKFAGPIGLAITAGQAIHGGFKGFKNADQIAGLKKGEKASVLQKTGATAAGALSSLSLGLVKPETIYKGLSAMVEFSPVGLLGKGFNKFFGDDKKEKAVAKKDRVDTLNRMKTDTAPSSAQTVPSMGSLVNSSNINNQENITKTDGGLVISNVTPASIGNLPTVKSPIVRLTNEGGVNNIINNTNGRNQVSEGSTLKNTETITDMRNQQKLFNTTREAINNISISSGGGSSPVIPPSIIVTGDTQSYIGRLARSY